MSASLATQYPDGLERIYRCERNWLVRWLRLKMGVSAERAEDLAQDTFVRVLLGKGFLEVQQPRSYLATIARGLTIDFFRRQDLEHAYLEYLAHSAAYHVPSPEERAIVLETLTEIDTLLQGLNPKARQAFLLSQLEGLTYAEIAIALCVSVSSIKKYMVQAVERCLLNQIALEYGNAR